MTETPEAQELVTQLRYEGGYAEGGPFGLSPLLLAAADAIEASERRVKQLEWERDDADQSAARYEAELEASERRAQELERQLVDVGVGLRNAMTIRQDNEDDLTRKNILVGKMAMQLEATERRVQELERERDAAQAWAREQSLEERDVRGKLEAAERRARDTEVDASQRIAEIAKLTSEVLHERDKMEEMARRADRFLARVEAAERRAQTLKAAVEQIADLPQGYAYTARDIATAALAETEEPTP